MSNDNEENSEQQDNSQTEETETVESNGERTLLLNGLDAGSTQTNAEMEDQYPEKEELPEELPVLPQPDNVIFPGMALPSHVTDEEQIQNLFQELEQAWGGLDFLVHSLAYAPKEELRGEYVESTTRDGFLTAHDISAWSLTRMAQGAYPLMKDRPDPAILTLSFLGAERYVPHYNVMGVAKASLEASVRYLAVDLGPKQVRVNAISAGPLKTLASSGISGFKTILSQIEQRAPLQRNISQEDVGNAAVYLASDLARGTTGEILYVDSGYNIMGL